MRMSAIARELEQAARAQNFPAAKTATVRLAAVWDDTVSEIARWRAEQDKAATASA